MVNFKKIVTSSFIIAGLSSQAGDFSVPSKNYQLMEWEILNFGYNINSVMNMVSFGSALRANITDNIQAGLKAEVGLGAGVSTNATGGSAGIGATSGIYLTGSYRFVDGYKKFRPFVGLSLGQLATAGVSQSVNTSNSNSTTVNQTVNSSNGGVTVTQSAGGVTQTATGGSGFATQLSAGFATQGIRLTLEYTRGFFGGGYNGIGLNLGFLLFGRAKK